MMARAVAALVVLSLALPATAGEPLRDAIRLVMHSHPVLRAEEAHLRELSRASDWSTEVNLGWTRRGTREGGAAGPNAGVQVSIPLFDRSHERKVASERAAVAEKRQQIRSQFLKAVRGLRELAARVESAETKREFAEDRVEYRRKQVDQGAAKASELWPAAERLTKAEQALQKAKDQLEIRKETVARRYGGDEWKQLKRLLDEHLRRNVP